MPAHGPNRAHSYHITPLYKELSARQADPNRVEALLRAGESPNALTLAGKKAFGGPLFEAMGAAKRADGDAQLVRLLLKYKATPDAPRSDGMTPLMRSTQFNLIDGVRALMDYGADVNAVDRMGRTALHYASYYGHSGICSVLIEGGADVNHYQKDGLCALDYAVQRNCTEAARVLLQNSARIEHPELAAVRTKYTDEPLYKAVLSNAVNLLNLLLKYGANPDVSTASGDYPLLCAVNCGHSGMVSSIIRHGGSTRVLRPGGAGALDLAVHHNKPESLMALATMAPETMNSIRVQAMINMSKSKANRRAVLAALVLIKGFCNNHGVDSLRLAILTGDIEAVRFNIEKNRLLVPACDDFCIADAPAGYLVRPPPHRIKDLFSLNRTRPTRCGKKEIQTLLERRLLPWSRYRHRNFSKGLRRAVLVILLISQRMRRRDFKAGVSAGTRSNLNQLPQLPGELWELMLHVLSCGEFY